MLFERTRDDGAFWVISDPTGYPTGAVKSYRSATRSDIVRPCLRITDNDRVAARAAPPTPPVVESAEPEPAPAPEQSPPQPPAPAPIVRVPPIDYYPSLYTGTPPFTPHRCYSDPTWAKDNCVVQTAEYNGVEYVFTVRHTGVNQWYWRTHAAYQLGGAGPQVICLEGGNAKPVPVGSTDYAGQNCDTWTASG